MKKKTLLFSCLIIILALALGASALVNSFTLTNPPDGNVTSDSWIQLNWSFVGFNISHVYLDFNGTSNTSIGLGNCSSRNVTTTSKLYYCGYNKTGLSQYLNHSWLVHINTTGRNGSLFNASATRYFVVDTGGITIDNVYNWTVTDSNISYIVQIGDYSTRSCIAQILEDNGTAWVNTFNETGTVTPYSDAITNYSGQVNCTGYVDATRIEEEGDFKIEFFVSDALGNVNRTNQTGIKLDLFTGWNMIGWPDQNTSGGQNTVAEICDAVKNCTQVSWRNNSGDAFVTYDTATPGVNNGTYITAGDPVMIYTTANSTVVGNDFIPLETSSDKFVTVYNDTWNAVALITDSNLSTIYNVEENGTTHKYLTWDSWNNQGTWYTCRRSTGRCTGTASAPTNITVKAGHGVWVYATNINATSAVINRTEMSS